jgi:N-acetylmuramoyl-L-alanine amidase
VPLRAIFEAMGATVDWNADTKTETATKGSTTVVVAIGSTSLILMDCKDY